MAQPFAGLICQGKKVHVPVDDRSIQLHDRLTTQAREAQIESDNTLVATSHSTLAASRQKVSYQTPGPIAQLTIDQYFQKPSPPSPLVNIPLSGKRLPILLKRKNKRVFHLPNEEDLRNKERFEMDGQGGGDSTVSTLINKIFLKDKGTLYDIIENTCNELSQPRYAPHLSTYTSSLISYTSPLTISSLDLLSKNIHKASKDVTAPSLERNAICETVIGGIDVYGAASGDRNDCGTTSCDKNIDCAAIADLVIADTNEISRYEKAQPRMGTLNIIGTKMKTPSRALPKNEIAKCPKVKYGRGITTSRALYASCCHVPCKARLKGAALNVSVCPQHAICYNAKVSAKYQPKAEMLFKFTDEENVANVGGRNTYALDNQSKPRLVKNKYTDQNKKKENGMPERKKMTGNSSGNSSRTVSKLETHCSRRAFLDRSVKVNQLSLHDDFPFHCFLLFQFEDRQKVMKRLSRLPQRYEKFLRKREQCSVGVNSKIRPRGRSKLIAKLNERKFQKAFGQKKVEDENTASNGCNDVSNVLAKHIDIPADLLSLQPVRLQTDNVAEMHILSEDNACDPTCEVCTEPRSVNTSIKVHCGTLTDSYWRNDEANEHTSKGLILSEKALSALEDEIPSTGDDIACRDNYEISGNDLESGLKCATLKDCTAFHVQTSDQVKCNENSSEMLDGKIQKKESYLCDLSSPLNKSDYSAILKTRSLRPSKSKSRLTINKGDNKEETVHVDKSVDEENVPHFVPLDSGLTPKVKDTTENAVDECCNFDLSIDTSTEQTFSSHSNDLTSLESCCSSKMCNFIPCKKQEENDNAIFQVNDSARQLEDEKGSNNANDFTDPNMRKFECISPIYNNVISNLKTDYCLAARVKDVHKGEVLPVISTRKLKSTFTGVEVSTQHSADAATRLPVIHEEVCRRIAQDIHSSKLRPKSSFSRTEQVEPGEALDSAFPVKLPSATVCSETRPKKSSSRCFFSESPDSGISVKSRNPSSCIVAEKVMFPMQRNQAVAQCGVDPKFETQELDLSAEKHLFILYSKTQRKLDIAKSSSGSESKEGYWQSAAYSHKTRKDSIPSVGSTIVKNESPHSHYPSLNQIFFSSNNLNIPNDDTRPTSTKRRANRVELPFKESAVISLPKVACELQIRPSTGFCKGSKRHRGNIYAPSYLMGKGQN